MANGANTCRLRIKVGVSVSHQKSGVAPGIEFICTCISDVLSLYNDSMSEIKPKLIKVVPTTSSPSRKSERTRAAILNGALEFLWVRPFREMTVAELMSITGVSRSAFYQYFNDLHELMETLLQEVAEAIFAAAGPWLNSEGEPTESLKQSLCELVDVGYERGPILRAVAEASTSDARLERTWTDFLEQFDDAICEQIEKHQQAGLTPEFDARPVTVALNRLDASMLIDAFGSHPRNNPEPVKDALTRIWMSTLYPSR